MCRCRGRAFHQYKWFDLLLLYLFEIWDINVFFRLQLFIEISYYWWRTVPTWICLLGGGGVYMMEHGVHIQGFSFMFQSATQWTRCTSRGWTAPSTSTRISNCPSSHSKTRSSTTVRKTTQQVTWLIFMVNCLGGSSVQRLSGPRWISGGYSEGYPGVTTRDTPG